jgi:hypothetical protein
MLFMLFDALHDMLLMCEHRTAQRRTYCGFLRRDMWSVRRPGGTAGRVTAGAGTETNPVGAYEERAARVQQSMTLDPTAQVWADDQFRLL